MNISDALKRVLNYTKPKGWFKRVPVYSGFYLTNDQIIQLGNLLKTHSDKPSGIAFMVGKEESRYTVEMIPYKGHGTDKHFYISGAHLGGFIFSLNPEYVPHAEPGSIDPFYWHNVNSLPGGGTSQRTPPPRID